MKHDVALKRLGVEIIKQEIDTKKAALFLRVKDQAVEKWPELLASLLLGPAKKWKLDATKYFYAQQGEVRFCWRLVFTGDVPDALSFLGSAVVGVITGGVKELDSFPLVGRAVYEHDPKNGKIKGAYEYGLEGAAGSTAVASAFGGVS